MRKTGIIFGAILLGVVLFSAGCAEQQRRAAAAVPSAVPGYEPAPAAYAAAAAARGNSPAAAGMALPAGIVSAVFVEDTDGTDGGVRRLTASMRSRGLHFHRTAAAPSGLIASGDVVLLKINAQWDQRGGTNTDVIREVIREILDHPEGFSGEIIVADNGQAQFGSFGRGGSLDWTLNNAEDTSHSTMSVIRYFQAQGSRVTGVLWDDFTTVRVREFSAGDMRDGFIMEDSARPTGIAISYPKFTTEFGTHVSFRSGIWDPAAQAYNSDILRVINMPVLKSHSWLQVTAAVKNYMGVPSDRLTRTVRGGRAHDSVFTGGMGTLMVYTRMPVLNITDMIWVGPDRGPRVNFNAAVRINKIAASTDAFALDYWTTRHILMPEAARLPGGRAPAMNPAGTEPGTFGHWMRLSMAELHAAGIAATLNPAEMLIVYNGEAL